MSEFSNRFRLLKEESELTLKELSNELDISIPNLSYYMKDREPSYDVLINIANYFNVTIDWLIGRTDTRSSAHDSLDNEILKIIKQNEDSDIPIDELKPLSIFKNDYQQIQDKLVELMAHYYTLLLKIEELQNARPMLDFSVMNSSLLTNFMEALEYQADFVNDAQWTILSGTSGAFFEYYFNSLVRVDLLVNRYKMFITDIIKMGTANFDGNTERITVVADFVKHAEQYSKNYISDTELNLFFNKLGI